MHYLVNDPKFADYKVELDGQVVQNAVEAKDDEGWVKTEKNHSTWGHRWAERKTLYGRVHIVKYEGYKPDEFEDDDDVIYGP